MDDLRQPTPRTRYLQCPAGHGFSEDNPTGSFLQAGNDQRSRLLQEQTLLPIIDGSYIIEDVIPQMMRNFTIPISGSTTSFHAGTRNQQTAVSCFGNGNCRVTAFDDLDPA